MNYIILDMEWNQPWPGSPSARKVLPVAIRGEIIQIGAVRVTETQTVEDEFQVLIKPKYYRHLNRRVSKLTGIKESRLKEEGMKTRLVLQIHDELMLEAPENEAEQAARLLKEEMESVAELKVPLTVESNIAKNWYDAK